MKILSEKFFCTLIQKGKGIEINVSGLRQKYGKPLPDLGYVKHKAPRRRDIDHHGSDALEYRLKIT